MERKRVALLRSFTEADGTKEKIGYREPRIEWLMDQNAEYSSYWIDGSYSLKNI